MPLDFGYFEYVFDEGASVSLFTMAKMENIPEALMMNVSGLVDRKDPEDLRIHCNYLLCHSLRSRSLETVKVSNIIVCLDVYIYMVFL